MKPVMAEVFTDHWIFKDYYNDAQPASSVKEVEEQARGFLDKYFDDAECQEDSPNEYLMYQVIQMTDTAELTEALASNNEWVRDVACKRYVYITSGWEYETWYLDVWSYAFSASGETHGTIIGMCCKSTLGVLHELGIHIWYRLAQIQGGGMIDFDT